MSPKPTTEHHTLTLEWASYPQGPGEVTAAFCSCGKQLEDDTDTEEWPGLAGLAIVAIRFGGHIRAVEAERGP